MPRSKLAQASGLSAQAVTDIVRDLLARGLIASEDRVRGRIGQPTVPLALAPRGAFSLGLQVGRRSAGMVLVDFAGKVLGSRTISYATPEPHPDAVIAFAVDAAAELTDPAHGALTADERARVAGIGVAMPFRMWDWGAGFAPWRSRHLASELRQLTGLPAWLENDASAACGAELIFGRKDLPGDFLHVYVGYYAGGGLVLGGQLWLGPHGNAAAIGSTPVPRPDGRVVQLLEQASLAPLEDAVGEQLPVNALHDDDEHTIPPTVRAEWLRTAGAAIAFASLSATTILDLEAVVIDGAMSAELRDDLVAAVNAALLDLPGAGVGLPRVLAGSLGRSARAIGAAALPLAEQFMLGVVKPSPATGG